jgi:murein DD-endopeptidase MepM/ murein hydrolase activator NlpD
MPVEADSSSRFGWRSDPFHGKRKFHQGLDLKAAYGTEVGSAGDGTVTFAGERGGYGLMVVVAHENGLETRYAHLASADVQPGERIGAGQTLGRVGSSGRSTGPHLHFEVLQDGQRVDPERATARVNAND